MKLEREKRKVIGKQIPVHSSITCGDENPASLGCRFYELEGGEVATVFAAKYIHEGHNGIMHGGLSAAVLDELMGRATLNSRLSDTEDWIPKYVTAEMTTKYKRPIAIGAPMRGFGRVDREEGRCCFTSSEIVDENGEIMASATGVYVRVAALNDEKEGYRTVSANREPLDGSDPVEL